MTEDLNPAQASAVAHAEGPLVVFAGAGSGKTRVITYRIANLIARHNVAPYRILAVTFTNKAAGEMRTRVAKLVGEEIARDVWLGTFHAMCARILRRNGHAIGIAKNFTIYDTTDQKALMRRVLKALAIDPKHHPPRAMVEHIATLKSSGRGPDDLDDLFLDPIVVRLYREFERQMRDANALDFEDLLKKTVELLRTDTKEARDLKRKFLHVLVDEFQDTSATQYELCRQLCATQNLCVVGDDDQSIYKWRGADARRLLGFRREFPDATVVKLEQNYRSTGSIVRAALSVISRAEVREPKELWTENAQGIPVDLVVAGDERDEADFTVRTVASARSEGVGYSDMAVLYRVHAQSRILEEKCRAARIPYQVVGGMKFFERAEVKDALSYLRILVNDQSDVDLVRVINTPARGIGEQTVEKLAGFASDRKTSMVRALDVLDESAITGAARRKLEEVGDLLRRLRTFAEGKLPHVVLENVITTTGYEAKLIEDGSAEAEARLGNLKELVTAMREIDHEIEQGGEIPTIEAFLERVTLRSDIDETTDDGRLTLMTVHAAKGLEFDTVIMTGMEEDTFPYRRMVDFAEERDIDEERRLAYVAMTRARKRLVMLRAQQRSLFGRSRFLSASRFMGEIPREIVAESRTGRAYNERSRYIDDPSPYPKVEGDFVHPQEGDMPPPQGPSSLGPQSIRSRHGETRYVDSEFFSDAPSTDDVEIRVGARVYHDTYGEGRIRSIDGQKQDPRAIAFFPDQGREVKILLRYLRILG